MTSAVRINCHYVFLFLILTTSLLIPEISYGRIVDRVLATVGGEAITLADYQKFVRTAGDVSSNEMVEQDILKKMIEEKILLHEAKRKGVEVSDTEVDRTIAEVKHQYSISPDDDEFEKMLKEEGTTLAAYRTTTRDTIMISKLIDSDVDAKVFIGDQEIDEYYRANQKEFVSSPETVEVKAIFLRLREGASLTELTDLKLKSLRVASLLQEGEYFDRLLYEYSDEPLKSNEGVLGQFRRGALVPRLDSVAFALREGETSSPVWVNEGAYILQLVRRNSEQYKTLSEVKEEIRHRLHAQKREKIFNEWRKILWEKSFVTINQP
jgi:peptidyl-prolyl cis-trans isomerase SurA